MNKVVQSASLRSKYRGTIVGAVVGDCMASRFDCSSDAFASVLSRIEPATLRSQIPRSGGSTLFPVGADSLMLLSATDSLMKHMKIRANNIDLESLQKETRSDIQSLFQSHSGRSAKVQWGSGTRNLLEANDGYDLSSLRTNCGLTRSLVAGLIKSEDAAASICSATHSHESATSGSRLLSRAISQGIFKDTVLKPDDIADFPKYMNIARKALRLASGTPYTEADEFSTDIQSRFAGMFGTTASSQCAIASALFAVYRTVHSLPYLDATSAEHTKRIEQVAKVGMDIQRKGIAMNTLGNSNRMDTASLFSKLTPSIEQDLPVSLAVAWAISLGGDVRSNACITGALAGSIWGEEAIPDEWQMFAENVDQARAVADVIFDLVHDS